MSYAVIESGGKQFRVTKGQTVRVPVLRAEPGESVEFSALLAGNGDGVQIGVPAVEGLTVRGTVVDHGRGTKIIVFKKKRKKQYKKTHGHRQNFTSVLIESIGDAAEAESSSSAAAQTKSAPASEAAAPSAAEPVKADAEPTAVNSQITDEVTAQPEETVEAKPTTVNNQITDTVAAEPETKAGAKTKSDDDEA